MANRVRSEHQSPSRPPLRLLGSVLLLGTLLAWWGTRDHRRLFGESLREPVAAGGAVLPEATQGEGLLLDRRGSQIFTAAMRGLSRNDHTLERAQLSGNCDLLSP